MRKAENFESARKGNIIFQPFSLKKWERGGILKKIFFGVVGLGSSYFCTK